MSGVLADKGCRGRLISGDLEVDKKQLFPIVWIRLNGRLDIGL